MKTMIGFLMLIVPILILVYVEQGWYGILATLVGVGIIAWIACALWFIIDG